MKGRILAANLEGQGWETTLLSFVGSNLGVDVLKKKSENQKKGARIEASLYAL